MIFNNLHKWFIRNEEQLIDSVIIIGGVLWFGLVIWGLNIWLAHETVCTPPGSAAHAKQAAGDRDAAARAAGVARWKNDNPDLARIVETPWRAAAKPQKVAQK